MLVYYRPYWFLLVSDLIAIILVAALTIAHRLSTIRNADEIFVLADTGIVQRGIHEQLIVQRGLYADLYNAQPGLVWDRE